MDDTDRQLMLLIYADPRIPVLELAKRLGISRQAVHHRMRILMKIGVFKNMSATISLHYLDALLVMVFGRSKTASIEETLDRLGESEFTSRVAVAGGNYLYVLGFLRDMSELDSYFEFVKGAAEMPEPTLGIHCLDAGIMRDYVDGGMRKQSYKELSPLDLKIIASLKDDARKPIAEVADRVGVSAKTVKRHLEDMISEGSVDFDEPWDATSGADMYTLMHVNLRNGADKVEVGRRLLSKHPLNVIYIRSFSNLPGFLFGVLCSDKMTEIRKILREIGEDEDVQTVTPNLLYFERTYMNTWDSRLPAVRTRPSEKARKHHLHSRLRIR